MNTNLACGDNSNAEVVLNKVNEPNVSEETSKLIGEQKNNIILCSEEKTMMEVDERDLKLKERIAHCRKTIESLKIELTEEKAKLQEESKFSDAPVSHSAPINTHELFCSAKSSKNVKEMISQPDTDNHYSSSVDSKLRCDDSLLEYEKQLQRYQNTLIMAQAEKKNAIRKQMLAKAYKLKLLEVENQCNIELLRVKQSLQCVESLQMIASKWKTSDSNQTFDLNNYELIPRYPELNPVCSSDVNIFTDDEKSARENSDDIILNP